MVHDKKRKKCFFFKIVAKQLKMCLETGSDMKDEEKKVENKEHKK